MLRTPFAVEVHNRAVDRLSQKARAGSVAMEEFRRINDALSPRQHNRIREKARYEQTSWLGVLADWPSLFKLGEEGE